MNILLILTVEWPYGKGETFFENEASFVTGFDKVYCIPLYPKGVKRLVPDNIEIVVSNCKGLSIVDYIKGAFSRGFFDELKAIIKYGNNWLSKIKVLLRFSGAIYCRVSFLNRWIRTIDKKDAITVYTYWMASDAAAASILKEKNRQIKKIVTRCHGFDLYEYANELNYIPYRRMIIESVDKIVPISRDGYDYLLSHYDYIDSSKVIVSKLGTVYRANNPEGEIDDSDVIKIVSCSNLIPIKRVELMINALKYLDLSVEWNHFGDGILRQELEYKARKLPHNTVFNFMGRVSNLDLMEWYSKNHVDLFINTSETEGIPVSIMEALSFGIPVIATDVGGTGEIVNNNNGFLLNKDFKCEDLAAAIRYYYTLSPSIKKKYREEALKSWQANYNANKNYNDFYANILKADE